MKLKNAVVELSDHKHILGQLEGVIEGSYVETWTTEVEAWEADSAAQNPFERRTEGKVLAAILTDYNLPVVQQTLRRT